MKVLERIKNFYREPAPAEPISDATVIDKTYALWRMKIFLSMFAFAQGSFQERTIRLRQ